jgi:superfamily II DNA or RNA helicase
MHVLLPDLWAIHEKNAFGHIRQHIRSFPALECNKVSYTRERDGGFLLTDLEGNNIAFVFKKRPKSIFTSQEPLLILSTLDETQNPLDLRKGQWLSHPEIDPANRNHATANAKSSWSGAFNYIEEDVTRNIIGFRKPQLGALHAINAHWSVSAENATIVMPTGTGKTETMLGVLISNRCDRVLVIAPTDALRTQISEKFESLGVLTIPGCEVLASTAARPVVGTLTSRPKSLGDVETFFGKCNVIVTTSSLIGGCVEAMQTRMAELCSHLFIDEAHHAEARTWKKFRDKFSSNLVLQFTATPFREDGQKIDGKLIYVYPLRKAQQEGYFRPIRFKPVTQYDVTRGDREIAIAAMDELDADSTGKHIVMARVSGTPRARQIHELYQSIGRYEAVVIHSKVKPSDREEAKRKLFSGEARVVICVDMLGEGFDLPELKIAAFHDIRKSLAITLQLAGRFTRSRADLGDPVFIANTALIDVSEELRQLYTQDPDWNTLLPDISETVINDEITSQEFFNGFGAFLEEVPLKDLRPAASMVVYKTHCISWHPERFKHGFKGHTSRDKFYHSLNVDQKTLVVLAATEQGVAWSDVQSIKELGWELFIAIWDTDNELLYLHGSNIDGSYKDIAKAICGEDVELIIAPNIFRAFHGVNRLILNNVGLNEFLGRQVRFTARLGSDVESRIGQAMRQGSTKAVLAGQGFDNGNKVVLGAAKRGRVWSHLRLRVDSFAAWAKAIGTKLANEDLDPEQVLAGTLKPTIIGSTPNKPAIAAEWPDDLYQRPEQQVAFQKDAVSELSIADVDIEVLSREDSDPIVINVTSETWQAHFKLEFRAVGESFDFKFFQINGPELKIRRGTNQQLVADFFTADPPSVWFSDGSCLEGCEYTELPSVNVSPFARERLSVFDWTGVDIKSESQGASRLSGTIQYRLIQHLQRNADYEVIFDDDGSGEAADVVAIKTVIEHDRTIIDVELYHCKFSQGSSPGARIDDLYAVCGQAQRSTNWLRNHDRRTALFTHLLRREDNRLSCSRPTRFERGEESTLMRIRDMSRRHEVRLKVWIVQPGLSATQASASQLSLLAVTERYLTDTYQIPLEVICSA